MFETLIGYNKDWETQHESLFTLAIGIGQRKQERTNDICLQCSQNLKNVSEIGIPGTKERKHPFLGLLCVFHIGIKKKKIFVF